MAVKHKFDSADMPAIRRMRNHLIKYRKLLFKTSRTERFSCAILPDVDLKKIGINFDIMDKQTKDEINKMRDCITTFRATMSTQLEEILFSAANSHYSTAMEIGHTLDETGEQFEAAEEMAEKYWERMNNKKHTKKISKPTKKPAKNTQIPSKSPPKPITKSPSFVKQAARPSAPKSTTKTPVTTPCRPTTNFGKATDNGQPKSTTQTLQTTVHGLGKPSAQSSMKTYFKTTKSSEATRQQRFPVSSSLNFNFSKTPFKAFRN